MSEQGVQALIAKLRHFRTRRAASEELVALGNQAVRPLMEALKSEEAEGARWAILNCLGELRAPQAVPAIAPYLEDSDFGMAAHEALLKIVGRDLGPAPAPWVQWAERHELDTGEPLEAPLQAAAATAPSDGRLTELALAEGCGTFRETEPGRYVVSLPVAEGAVKEVTIVFGSTDQEGAEIVIIYADCGDARPEHYETALRLNLRMPYGAIALRDVGGKPCFVMFNTILRQALTPIELRKSVFTIGERARRVERELHR